MLEQGGVILLKKCGKILQNTQKMSWKAGGKFLEFTGENIWTTEVKFLEGRAEFPESTRETF